MKIAVGVLANAVGIAAWLVAASYLYCRGIGRPEWFEFPYDQWWLVLPAWRYNWATTFWVMVSGAIPTLALAFVVKSAFRWVFPMQAAAQSELYGRTGWASQDDMIRGGLQVRKRF